MHVLEQHQIVLNSVLEHIISNQSSRFCISSIKGSERVWKNRFQGYRYQFYYFSQG